MHPLRLIDSITELELQDKGCIAVSGSHGGISSAGYALAIRPFFSVFNDAGGGLNNAGWLALELLQHHGLAACTVAHCSAQIGSSASTLANGLVNHVNECAASMGIRKGWTCQQAVDFLNCSD